MSYSSFTTPCTLRINVELNSWFETWSKLYKKMNFFTKNHIPFFEIPLQSFFGIKQSIIHIMHNPLFKYTESNLDVITALGIYIKLTLSARGILCLIEDCPHSGWFSVSCFSISSILVDDAWSFLCCSRSCLIALTTDGSLLMLEACGWFQILNGLKFHIPNVSKVSNSSSRLDLVSSLGWSVRSGSRRDRSVTGDYAVSDFLSTGSHRSHSFSASVRRVSSRRRPHIEGENRSSSWVSCWHFPPNAAAGAQNHEILLAPKLIFTGFKGCVC